ncbi:MAG: high-potential iron-sulfur protein [Pseudomonadota bacterium]
MSKSNEKIERRQFVKLASAAVLAAPLGGLAGCGDSGSDAGSTSSPASSAPPPQPEPQAAPPAAAPEPAPAAPPAAGMEKVDENDTLAQSLGYRHAAADVDLTKFPKRGEAGAENQYCKNCVLFQGGDNEWGACSIFGGKMVNAGGWCATYAPKG